MTDAIGLQRVLREISDSVNPLRGVVHAAMVLDDGMIKNMSMDSWNLVLQPKILGAWNLHNLTLGQQLDFFVLYSSATTCIGNPGQANYVTANYYLESLAKYRHEAGLTALAISWDAITDAGYLAREHELRERFTSKLGIKGITSRQAFEKLEKLLLSDNIPHAVVLKANWESMKRTLPIAHSHMFKEIMHGVDENDVYSGEDILEILDGLSDDEKQVVVINMLVVELSRILHIAEDKIEHHKPIQEIGVDSLMGMELATVIGSRFSVDIPLMVLANNITVDSLASRLIKALYSEKDDIGVSPISTVVIASSLALTHAEELTGEDMEKMVEDIDEGIKINRHLPR